VQRVEQKPEQIHGGEGAPFHEDFELRSPSSIGQLFELTLVIARRIRFIGLFVACCALGAVVVSILLPNIYTGRTRILPPQQSQSLASAFLGQLGPLAGLAGKDMLKTPADTYMEMLESDAAANIMVKRFDLMTIYQSGTNQDCLDELRAHTKISSTKSGIIVIDVEDKSPQRAADMANAYVEALSALTQTLAVTEASQRRLFFERQRQATMEDLIRAETALKGIQEKTGLIQLEGQAKSIIESVAVLRAQIGAKQVQLQAMRSFGTEQNPDVIRTERELQGLRDELAKMQKQNNGNLDETGIPTKQVPEAGLEYARRLREVKYSETMYEMLSKEYEVARIDEAKNAAIIQVLDKAVPPEKKTKPKRSLIALFSIVVSFIIASLLVVLAEIWGRFKARPQTSAYLNTLKGLFGTNRSRIS